MTMLRPLLVAATAALTTLGCVGTPAETTLAPPTSAKAAAETAFRVAPLFGDHMVLQRDVPLPVWGRAEPGARVTVTARDQTVAATADPDGRWTTELAPLTVGDPLVVTVSSGNSTVRFTDVLVGEVWLCSGQSNMAWRVQGSDHAAAEIAAADHPQIRLITLPRVNEPAPRTDLDGVAWQICSPETIGPFSAVGYYFGRDLNEKLDVPVGLINSNYGGTPIEAWTSAAALKLNPDFTARVETIEAFGSDPQAVAETREEISAWQAGRTQALADTSDDWKTPDLDDHDWGILNVPGDWESQGYPGLDGIMWYRRTFDVPKAQAGKKATLRFGKVDHKALAYLDGTELTGKNRTRREHRFEVPAGVLSAGPHALAVRVSDTSGPGGLLGKPGDTNLTFADGTALPLAGEWKAHPSEMTAELSVPEHLAFFDRKQPTGLYNTMINPLIPFAMRGVIWYQGESNVGRAKQYRDLFPRMINDWRSRWGNPLSFYWVQLANYKAVADEPGPSDWAELREAQNLTLSVPRTGQAVIIELGEANDIHPTNKQDVGSRLARIALANDYGQDLEYAGPTLASMQIEGNVARLSFDHAEGLAARDGGPLQRFEIAGKDKVFVWADAKIDGTDVLVHHSAVPHPVAVRYAWSDNPEGANLVNAADLPASPFRTDVDAEE